MATLNAMTIIYLFPWFLRFHRHYVCAEFGANTDFCFIHANITFFYYYVLGISFLAGLVVFLASHFSQRFLYWLSSKIFKPKTVLALIVNLKLESSFKHLASTYLGILLRCLGRSLSAFLYDNLFLCFF